MANATTTSLNYRLKTIYPNGVATLGYEQNPFMGMLKKRTDFTGENQSVPIRYAPQTGRSVSFTRAQALKNPSAGKKFLVTRAKDYALGGIDAEAIKAAMGDKGSIGQGLQGEIESLTYSLTRSIATSLFRNGGGVIGVADSGEASNNLHLATPDDAVFFEVGMTLDGSATPGFGGAAVQGGANAVIVAIDRTNGILTNAGANWNAGTAINGLNALGAKWYLFASGDYGGKLKGLDAWLPATAPTPGDNFFGIDRSVDVDRLAGLRIAAKSTINATLLQAMAQIHIMGGKCDTILLHPLDFKALVEGELTKVMYTDAKSSDVPSIGYKAVEIIGQTGPAKVVADLNCPRGVAYGLQLDTWTLWSLDDLIHVADDDGNKMLRDATNDGVEIRMRSFSQLVCRAPGYNARIVLPAAA